MPLGPGVPLQEVFQAVSGQPRRLRLDAASRRVWVGGKEVDPRFRCRSSACWSHSTMLREGGGPRTVVAVWGDVDSIGVSEQALDALVRRLRDRLRL